MSSKPTNTVTIDLIILFISLKYNQKRFGFLERVSAMGRKNPQPMALLHLTAYFLALSQHSFLPSQPCWFLQHSFLAAQQLS
jgi:hypothetical protein